VDEEEKKDIDLPQNSKTLDQLKTATANLTPSRSSNGIKLYGNDAVMESVIVTEIKEEKEEKNAYEFVDSDEKWNVNLAVLIRAYNINTGFRSGLTKAVVKKPGGKKNKDAMKGYKKTVKDEMVGLRLSVFKNQNTTAGVGYKMLLKKFPKFLLKIWSGSATGKYERRIGGARVSKFANGIEQWYSAPDLVNLFNFDDASLKYACLCLFKGIEASEKNISKGTSVNVNDDKKNIRRILAKLKTYNISVIKAVAGDDAPDRVKDIEEKYVGTSIFKLISED
jgi:hypothetical protein